ncbi:DeoR/GlpR family DNA-binding transcription regulator [Ferrovibrio sp.]|uniref:DeoR/GlpR family DNA-binding transcription regulator n=1 Tax=Ferrovibrio sp. TaxID=1917215 RepID=UPI0025C04926|nr:DeoR/GlpR family DNA-binding transcription regulator [Ferrovibrio sp.]MBX3453608.1 DeoR/GlpR transcriptional regulator [Ferrovibrio sp.]
MAIPADDRARAIVDLVRHQGFQTIEALAGSFGVTPQTVRRDVNLLCDRGLLRRRHGGVEAPPREIADGRNLAYPERSILNLQAKRAIAAAVAAAVPAGSSLFFGIGTTPEQCALALTGHAGLRAMTNNLNVAFALARNPDTQIILAGGEMRNIDRDVVAGEAQGFFAHFAVDIGIYGVGGVAEDGTLLDFSQEEVAMRQSLARNCRQRFLVLDHSKFGRGATVRGGHVCEASMVFTDQPPPPAIAAMLAEAGCRLVVADLSVLSSVAQPTHPQVQPDRRVQS